MVLVHLLSPPSSYEYERLGSLAFVQQPVLDKRIQIA